MKQKLFYSFLLFQPLFGFAQDAKLNILPFINVTTSIKDGQIEAGPELNWSKDENGQGLIIRPIIRMPLTSKSDNVIQIDRFSSTWRGILAIQYTKVNAGVIGSISSHSIGGHFEYGSSEFKYYPTGTKSSEIKDTEVSYAFELKYIGFFTKGKNEAKQFSPQFRLRYSYDWKAANEVGVVNPPNNNGVVATTNVRIDAPSVKPLLSPALSLQYYPGKGSFSYAPTVYYDFTGASGNNNPFQNLNRLRFETWVFYYPLIKDNVKIGVSPFLNIRTQGADNFNELEYGGMITVKFGTTFLHFF
ncbi:MAG: hypothetical protein GYB55_08565 [Cytophagales bacterium]|uniref:hypothetical protein n=1 Tax=Cyclobacterium marinum TaxID=104 RepID=UPI0030D9C026|nr:hypothetical protein [Cytophagales bacterium]|tara:strand:+ start:3564 stop:4469 length:906 start_codon:yes stop_codon:yes gene_type:complete